MKNNLKRFLMFFMIMQPLFDIYYLYTDKIISIFKFSPATIIRMIMLGILFLLSYLYSKDKKKSLWLTIFIGVYLLYSIFHHLNAASFSVSYVDSDKYNILKELFYIIRMIMPILMIYITRKADLKEKNIKTIVYSVSLIFCLVIIFTNLTKLSLTSYHDGNKQILVNFLEWFNNDTYIKYTYEDVASKGIFHMANQISGLLIGIMPIILYFYFKEKPKFINIFTLCVMGLSMLMLGTRVASYGWILSSIAILIEYLFFVIIKKEYKINKYNVIIILGISGLFCAILPYSPVSNRTYAEDEATIIEKRIKESNTLELHATLCEELEDVVCHENKIAFIRKYWDLYGFDKRYIVELYPYDRDYDFWYPLFKTPYVERANHRQLKTMITKRLMALDNNKMDYVLGLSFTRLRNIETYMENDIYVHLYSVGIIGILLFICPYLAVGIVALYLMFKNKKFNFINCVYLSCIGLIFIAGIVSGNVFDEWIVTLFLGFICGNLLNNTKED